MFRDFKVFQFLHYFLKKFRACLIVLVFKVFHHVTLNINQLLQLVPFNCPKLQNPIPSSPLLKYCLKVSGISIHLNNPSTSNLLSPHNFFLARQFLNIFSEFFFHLDIMHCFDGVL
ncbi:hypothetical protein ACB094_11G118300 [Castanea mollissima]